CLIEAKVIGVMHMIDDDEQDDKIVAVANNDMAVNYINDISELPPHTIVELRRFFEDYKKLEHKQVIVEQFLGRDDAYKIINEAVDLYNQEKDRLIK
ncbi:MAG: inorganic diphosphatase, partial [Ignavibacterium sp.]|nr:inorganic diphosphatase [Ignavibacterium sp.]